MRFATRILIGVAAAAAVTVAAPVAAGATTTGAATPSGTYSDSWGPYHSSDHKAKAKGHVEVEKKTYKHWHWKTVIVPKKVCKWHDGEKKCWWVKKEVKKRVWEWKHVFRFDVHGKLYNDKWWGKNKCAWTTFKVVTTDGDTSYERFKNCWKHPKHFSFSGENAAHIYVNVSRGNHWNPKGWHSGWQDVYHAV
ncbi:hypothetical protein OUY22_04025 [Nonomuraea sp. MCN248]|uniref:Uncharacterized protein n=1 Tax=Nonomuraea corallina TaxID=2989783 RepID=A0ABT4S5T7_9ACTN|nr:hypothetical protein [Nonomuraea corallina]MDA0632573.1 hypothetical protein [Nonomuraea corallina]